jgi:hypothetical protein
VSFWCRCMAAPQHGTSSPPPVAATTLHQRRDAPCNT